MIDLQYRGTNNRAVVQTQFLSRLLVRSFHFCTVFFGVVWATKLLSPPVISVDITGRDTGPTKERKEEVLLGNRAEQGLRAY